MSIKINQNRASGNKFILALTAVLAFGILSTGCGKIDSSEITTKGMFADFLVGQTETGKLYFDAALFPDYKKSTTFVDLSEGDKLQVVQGENSLELSRDKNAITGAIRYNSEKAAAADMEKFDTSKEFQFQLIRGEESGLSALESKATIPVAIKISAPEEKAKFNSKTEDLELTWGESSDDRIILDIKGDCIIDYSKELKTDDGKFTLTKKSLFLLDKKSTCDLTVILSRVKDGSIDANFKGGHIRGKQTDIRVLVLDNNAEDES